MKHDDESDNNINNKVITYVHQVAVTFVRTVLARELPLVSISLLL